MLLQVRLAVPLPVERRDVAHTAVAPERQPVALGHGEKGRQDALVAMDVVVRVDVRRQLPGQLDEALELSFDLCLRLRGSAGDRITTCRPTPRSGCCARRGAPPPRLPGSSTIMLALVRIPVPVRLDDAEVDAVDWRRSRRR